MYPAGKLAIRFAYASDGQGIYGVDMKDGAEGPLTRYPTPSPPGSTRRIRPSTV